MRAERDPTGAADGQSESGLVFQFKALSGREQVRE
jgi:hypothetical protein